MSRRCSKATSIPMAHQARKERPGSMPEPLTRHHPRDPATSLESLRALAGVFALCGPMPSTRFLDSETECRDEDSLSERGGH